MVWDEHFDTLKLFKKYNKDGEPSYDSNQTLPSGTNTKLGQWCALQRRLKHEGKLEAEKFQKLNKIGFSWN